MDHDQLFKDLLTTFFAEFLELFFPRIAAELDRHSIEFLDKELSTDLAAGERHQVDLLAKARLHGRETFILIHVENQSTYQSEFPKRMFRYFAMLDRKFDLPVFPIAIFSYDRPLTPAMDAYSLELFDFPILRFQFHAIQLNRLSWREFLNKPNPVASALMAKMSVASADRPRVKLECLRMMLTLKLDPARSTLIAAFMKSYLALSAMENLVYDEAVRQLGPAEQEKVMKYTSEWEDRGRVEASVSLVIRQLHRKFGSVPPDLSEQISSLSEDHLSNLAEALLDFNTLADAHVWVANVPRG
jgi:hypothetical protein